MMNPIASAAQVSSFYGTILGLNNVSFEVLPGITGLVGPNGAGKSTLIKLVTGQLSPSSGEIRVFGETPKGNENVLARIGYCPEREQLRKDSKPIDWLVGLCALSGRSLAEGIEIAEKALERVRLDPSHWTKPMGAYSKGMKQRVKLAQAIMLDPELIVLDEPMNGLDPNGRNDFSEILKELSEEGKSILISSHILQELETLCNRFLILNWGRLLASGSPTDIRQKSRHWSDEVTIRCSEPKKLATFLLAKEVITGFRTEGDSLTLWLSDPKSFYKSWTDLISGSQVTIYDFRNQNQALTNLFEQNDTMSSTSPKTSLLAGTVGLAYMRIRELLTWSSGIRLLIVFAIVFVVHLLVGIKTDSSRFWVTAIDLTILGFLPFYCLVKGGESLRSEIRDGTIEYSWTRPSSKSSLYAGYYASSIIGILLFTRGLSSSYILRSPIARKD